MAKSLINCTLDNYLHELTHKECFVYMVEICMLSQIILTVHQCFDIMIHSHSTFEPGWSLWEWDLGALTGNWTLQSRPAPS